MKKFFELGLIGILTVCLVSGVSWASRMSSSGSQATSVGVGTNLTLGSPNIIGDAGSTLHGLAANDDLFVSGILECTGVSFFDGAITGGSTLAIAGALSGVTTLAASGNVTLSNNTALITHSGSTSLTMVSTSGTVGVESVVFTGGAISAATSIAMGGTLTGVTTAITGTANNALAISVPTQGANTNAGVGISLIADAGGSGTTGGAGGAVAITAGAAQGSGANNGGSITLTPGAKTGAGTAGVINLVGAVAGITTETLSGDLTMSGNTVNLTHSGSTSLTIASTSGTVGVESVVFTGGAISSATTLGMAGNLTDYVAVNDGNPLIYLGSSAAERLSIQAVYNTGAQTLDAIQFTTTEAGSTADKGRYIFAVDGTDRLTIDDGGIHLVGGVNMSGTIVGITTAITGTLNNALAISVPDQGATTNNGVGLTITADAGGTGTTGGNGGAIGLTGGDGKGSGDKNGGSITLTAGRKANSGAEGSILLNAGGANVATFTSTGVNLFTLSQADLTASCTTGQLAYDTGGAADELCYCQATNTWMCVTVTAGPSD